MAAPPFCVFPRSQTDRKDANSAKSRKTEQYEAKRCETRRGAALRGITRLYDVETG